MKKNILPLSAVSKENLKYHKFNEKKTLVLSIISSNCKD